MYSFLLVDDESYIRSAIAKLVDWKSLGIDKVFQAENGLEAQNIIKNENIDIVLSDIEMPNMDGLVLSKWICENHPSITVAILTGHERFDYAKQCMEYGVKQYLLKPVGVHSIQTKISQIVDELDKKRLEKERVEDLQNQIDESKSVLKDKIFYRLVCTPLGIQDSMETRFEYIGVHFDFSFNAVAIFDSNYNFASCKNLDKFLSHQANAIKLVIGDKHIVFNVDSRYSVVIFDINTITGNIDRSEKAISQMLYNKVNDVKVVLEEDSGLEITCGIGAPCNKMEDLFSSFSQAKTALSYQVSLGMNKIYDINDMSKFESSFYYPEDLIVKLVHSIMFDSVEIIEETLTAINYDMMKNHSLSPENIQMINIEIITHIFKELYKVEDIDPSIWQDGLSLYSDIQKAKLNKNNLDLIAKFAIKSSLQFSNKRTNSKSRIVEKTKKIVTSRYSDTQLSLSEIAYELNISTGYLSTVFKGKTGETLSKYISKTRIEAAMLLLKTTNKMTYEIAEDTGFDNAHYFSYAFKKVSGISPTEYRESKKRRVSNA